MDFNAVMQALPIAAAGMLGVFAVIAVIMLFITVQVYVKLTLIMD